MSGRYVRLRPGRYTLDVSGGEGPAGVRRGDGGDVRVEVDGGRVDFEVGRREAAYYWWRGPRERPGVRLLGVVDGAGEPGARAREPIEGTEGTEGTERTERAERRWPTSTTG